MMSGLIERVNVQVCGPNLKNESKGSFHVHAEGCRDLRQYGPGRKRGGHENGEETYVWAVDSKLDVVAEIYSNILDENEHSRPEEFLSDFWFAPCVDLELGVSPE